MRVARENANAKRSFSTPRVHAPTSSADLAPTRRRQRACSSARRAALERALAVTGLERFARCAFMGYAHVVLAAREVEQKDELPDAREEGTLVHEVLAAAFVATRELWPRRPRPAGRDPRPGRRRRGGGSRPVAGTCRRYEPSCVCASAMPCAPYSALRSPTRAWDFALAEQTFGARGETSWKALDLDGRRRAPRRSEGRSIGSIARTMVECCASSTTNVARRPSRDAASSLGETALQVPLYACVAGRELGLLATGAYVPTQARDVAVEAKPTARATQRMEELRGATAWWRPDRDRATALAIVASARSGALAPVPAHESECRYCAVSGGCRKPRFAMAPIDDADDERDAGGEAREGHALTPRGGIPASRARRPRKSLRVPEQPRARRERRDRKDACARRGRRPSPRS